MEGNWVIFLNKYRNRSSGGAVCLIDVKCFLDKAKVYGTDKHLQTVLY